jgi:capsular polysaccharide biosynthesis protein/tetratricopeptide (TPR) repeat protein
MGVLAVLSVLCSGIDYDRFKEVHQLGVGQLERNDLVSAAASFAEAATILPTQVDAHTNLVVTLQALGRYEQAKLSVQKIIALQPGYLDAYTTYGQLHIKTHSYAEALTEFEKAAAIEPNTASVHMNVATAWHYQRNVKCLDHYREALRYEPSSTAVWNNMGSAFDSFTTHKEYPGIEGVDKSKFCFRHLQDLSLRSLNERAREREGSASSERRCLARTVHDWHLESDVSLFEVASADADADERASASCAACASAGSVAGGQGSCPSACMPAGSSASLTPLSFDGATYGAAKPNVLDRADLVGFRLNHHPDYQHMRYSEKRAFVAHFGGGRFSVSGKTGMVYSRDRCRLFLFSEGAYIWLTEENNHPLWDGAAASDATAVELPLAASVVQMSSNLYYHWLLESLPRLLLLKDVLAANPTMALLVPGQLGRVQEALAILGWPLKHRIILHEPRVEYRVHDLYVADWRPTDARSNQEFEAPRRALRAMRHGFSFAAQAFAARSTEAAAYNVPARAARPHPPRVLFISRSGNLGRPAPTMSRAMANEPEVVSALRGIVGDDNMILSRGSDWDMRRTVLEYGRADIVVGVFGGALANIVFCEATAHVVEISLQEPAYRTYMHAAAALGLRFWVVTDAPENSYEGYPVGVLDVDIEKVSAIVRHIAAEYE